MKAIVWTKAGPPDVLQLQDVAKPTPKNHEVLIRIRATTATAADCKMRVSNTPRLFKMLGLIKSGAIIIGQELVGEIEAVGQKVTRYKVGDAVIAWSGLRLGTYAEFICLPEGAVMVLKPSWLSYEDAAPLPVGGVDATYFMQQANIQPGHKVLINGACGTMGTYAVQLAKHFGAEVTGVDSAPKLDVLRAIGADHVVDYEREDFTLRGETYNAIFDVIGTTSSQHCMNLLAPDGRYLLANPQRSQVANARWMARGSRKQVIPWKLRSTSAYADDFAFIMGLMQAGQVKSIIDRVYPLEQVAEAHRYIDNDLKKGQVVLRVE